MKIENKMKATLIKKDKEFERWWKSFDWLGKYHSGTRKSIALAAWNAAKKEKEK